MVLRITRSESRPRRSLRSLAVGDGTRVVMALCGVCTKNHFPKHAVALPTPSSLFSLFFLLLFPFLLPLFSLISKTGEKFCQMRS